jgi:hypothetical protein
MNPLKKRSRSLFDEMESMPEGNYQESYERRGGPRVGAEEMFEQMNRGMLSDPNSVVRQGEMYQDPRSVVRDREMYQNMPYNPDPGSVVRPEEMYQNMPYTPNPNIDPRDIYQNMPYIYDPSQNVDPRDLIQLMQGGQPLSENEMNILQQLMQQQR